MSQLDSLRRPVTSGPKGFEGIENSANDEFGQEIITQIQRFERSLDGKFDTGVQIPGHVFFTLTAVKKWQSIPLICFYGIADGGPVAVFQHHNQVNFNLVRSPIAQPSEPRKPIGFTTEGE